MSKQWSSGSVLLALVRKYPTQVTLNSLGRALKSANSVSWPTTKGGPPSEPSCWLGFCCRCRCHCRRLCPCNCLRLCDKNTTNPQHSSWTRPLEAGAPGPWMGGGTGRLFARARRSLSPSLASATCSARLESQFSFVMGKTCGQSEQTQLQREWEQKPLQVATRAERLALQAREPWNLAR